MHRTCNVASGIHGASTAYRRSTGGLVVVSKYWPTRLLKERARAMRQESTARSGQWGCLLLWDRWISFDIIRSWMFEIFAAVQGSCWTGKKWLAMARPMRPPGQRDSVQAVAERRIDSAATSDPIVMSDVSKKEKQTPREWRGSSNGRFRAHVTTGRWH